jgi:acetoacetate decarboxylase
LIKKEDWGYTNPIVSDLYGKPPLIWKGMDVQIVVCEADIRSIEQVVPQPLKVRSNLIFVWHSDFDLGATQGTSLESSIYTQVEFEGLEGEYQPFLYVASHLPLTGGREIWGYQKKMAQIELAWDMEAVRGQTTRLGHQIMKALAVPTYQADAREIPWSSAGVFSVKYVPSAEEGGEPLRELILTPGVVTFHEGKLFGGRGSVRFEASEIDPTYLLKPSKIVGGYYGKADLFLPLGKIVHRYR